MYEDDRAPSSAARKRSPGSYDGTRFIVDAPHPKVRRSSTVSKFYPSFFLRAAVSAGTTLNKSPTMP